jgi:hypothetical protein
MFPVVLARTRLSAERSTKAVEPQVPKAAIPSHPCFDVSEGIGAERVTSMLSVTTHLDEAELQEDSQMAGDTGLMHVDAFDDLRYGPLPVAKELDDPEARGISERRENRLHLHEYT